MTLSNKVHKGNHPFQHGFQEPRGVWRVQKGDIEPVAVAGEIGGGVLAKHLGVGRQSRRLEVLPDHLHRLGVPVHKHAALGAPAEGLDAQLSAAGEQIQHPAALQFKLQGAEERLLDPAGGGAGILSRQRLQPPPTGLSGNDSHMRPWPFPA